MMIGDAMTPFDPTGSPVWPRFTVDVAVFEVKFDVTAFDVNIFVVYVPVFDITTLYPFLQFLLSRYFGFVQYTIAPKVCIMDFDKHNLIWRFDSTLATLPQLPKKTLLTSKVVKSVPNI